MKVQRRQAETRPDTVYEKIELVGIRRPKEPVQKRAAVFTRRAAFGVRGAYATQWERVLGLAVFKEGQDEWSPHRTPRRCGGPGRAGSVPMGEGGPFIILGSIRDPEFTTTLGPRPAVPDQGLGAKSLEVRYRGDKEILPGGVRPVPTWVGAGEEAGPAELVRGPHAAWSVPTLRAK